MLNNDDGTITFILQMAVAPKTDDLESWITERSSRVTFEFKEMKTRRFEWFLSTDKSKATLIEVFDDSEGALTRFNNLISSPIAPEWMDRFEVEMSDMANLFISRRNRDIQRRQQLPKYVLIG